MSGQSSAFGIRSRLVAVVLCAALLLLTAAGPAFAAGEEPWTAIPTGVTNNVLYGIDFASPQTGWAVGAAGTIAKTTDGGGSWAAQASGTNVTLGKVDFVDANTGWVAGDVVLKTTNGGAAWAPVSGITGTGWRDVMFRDASVGLVVGSGGAVRRTLDGGATWQSRTVGSTQLRGISRVGDTWFVVGEGGRFAKSTNDGDTWTTSVATGTPMFFGVWFLDTQKGFAVSANASPNGRVWRTDDGGTSWQAVGPQGGPLRGVGFADANVGYAYGDGGRLLYTLDGGLTWTAGTSGTTQGLWDSAFPGYGYIAAGNSTVLKSGFDATPPPTVSTPASSSWTLALLGVLGLGMVALAGRRLRMAR